MLSMLVIFGLLWWSFGINMAIGFIGLVLILIGINAMMK